MGRDQSPKAFGGVCIDSAKVATCKIDFEWGNAGLETGIVQQGLDINSRKPVYANGNNLSPKGTVHNATTFNRWFNDSPWGKNIPHNLTLTNTPTNPRIYGYDDQAYFPFDGKGWDIPAGTDQYTDLTGAYHNFHFCSEAHGRFAYKGGETFSFLGDDDVFVFINNKLALDLGGVHGPASGTFSLDNMQTSFNLQIGSNYRFDFFWCERHTHGSDIKLTTSLEIFCSYYDWCDICDGNGQSCCPAGACDDNNKCTLDLCAVLVPPTQDCQHIQTNCTASDICHTSTCAPSTGVCSNDPLVCPSDGNPCTIESCDPTRGGCLSTQKVCTDNMGLCTTKTCNTQSGNCQFTPVTCNDNNACTTDSCDPVRGCVYTPLVCNDNNPCTDDTCQSTGPGAGCVYTPKNCNDNSVCTTDSCVNGQCQFVPISCNDNNMCTNDNCDAIAGCQYSPVTCDDSNYCTSDSCIPATGCQFTPISCDDSNACTKDSCNPFSSTPCSHAPITCDDGDICTYNQCDRTTGCNYPRKNCNDNNACTNDACGAGQNVGDANACSYTTVSCNDNEPCTDDSCNTQTGCVHQPHVCASANKTCDRTSCSAGIGCVTTTLPAAECNACYDSSGNSLHPCDNTDKCHPQLCSVDLNGNAICIFVANVTCDDGNKCTTDSCVKTTGQCQFTPIPCSSSDLCIVASCDTKSGVCSKTPVNCDDGNACTVDSCSGGVCSNTLISSGCQPCGTGACNTTDFCNPFVCNVTTSTCVSQPVICNDGNACTDDACEVTGVFATTCKHTPHDCVADIGAANIDACHPIGCDSNTGCYQNTITCDDANPCTSDACHLNATLAAGYVCVNNLLCPSDDPCNPNVCLSDGSCQQQPVDCNDHNPCTADSCKITQFGDAYCSNPIIPCNYTDFCMPASCNATTGACEVHPVDCNDNILCTIDSCNSNNGTCNNVLNLCNDFNNCTIDQCFNDANSTDGCVNDPVVCPDTLCAVGSCDQILGCVLTPIDCHSNDTDFCTAMTCDESVGCLNVTRTCLLSDLTVHPAVWQDDYPNYWKVSVDQQKYKDNDCFSASCDRVMSKCVVAQRQPFGSDCQFAYLDQGKKAAILTAGAIAGVVIAAVVFAALAGFGAKKGYDAWVRMQDERMGAASTNPMYAPSSGSGTNALYA